MEGHRWILLGAYRWPELSKGGLGRVVEIGWKWVGFVDVCSARTTRW